MLDRIERVARVKGVEFDVGKFFERKEGYEDRQREKKQFSDMLTRELEKEEKPENEAGPGTPNAYSLELSVRPTQSLFYRGQADISRAEGRMHESGSR